MKRTRAEVLSTRRVGAYQTLTIVAPEVAERARPGQFVAIAMPEGREFLLRRHFFIHQASRRGGWAGTVEFVIRPGGQGTSWLASAKAHSFVDLIGPLGKPFAYPKRLTNCLLVAQGHAAAPIYFLAQELLTRGRRVDMVVGADTQDDVFKAIEAKRLSQTVSVVTADGSMGRRGRIVDAIPDAIEKTGAQVVYAAGQATMLAEVAALCRERSLPAQVAVEEPMGCGYGLCNGCVIPVARPNGAGFEHLRTCVDGPVFDPARVLWDRWLAEEPHPVHAAAAPVPATRAGIG